MKLTKINIYTKSFGTSQVFVVESIPLKRAFATKRGAFKAAQAYDDALDANAHVADGHIDHAKFFLKPGIRRGQANLIVAYPWRDYASLKRLLKSEDRLLGSWFKRHVVTSRRRLVHIMTELSVEV